MLFAQKASAVSKCAGFNPRELDLEQFRASAATIFVRAYNAIYKERILSLNPETSEEDPAVGAQTVIDNLLQKTGVSALGSVTGQEVVEGSHRAIGILVGVLFAEGQRMWLLKQEEKKVKQLMEQPQPPAPARIPAPPSSAPPAAKMVKGGTSAADILDAGDEEDGAAPSSPKKPRKLKKKKAGAKAKKSAVGASDDAEAAPEYNDEQFEDEDDGGGEGGGEEKRATNQRKEKKEEGAPKEYDELVERIRFLEKRLKKKVGGSPGKSRRARNKEIALAGLPGRPAADDALPPPQSALPPAPTRPSSAPSVGGGRKLNPASRRLNSATPSAKETSDQGSAAPSSPRSPPLSPKYPASWYTYDMSSGRRVLMSEAEREALEARRKKETLGNVKSMSEMPDAGDKHASRPPLAPVKDSADAPLEPTVPHWPGPSTGMSTEAWVKRQKEAREPTGKLGLPLATKSAATQNAIAAFREPKLHSAYRFLENHDLVVSIEHCHSCECHNVTLRHKPGEYAKRADAFLKSLSQTAHECNLAARVGVTRFNTHIIAAKRLSDVDNRIGAFEVQVAYRTGKGELRFELLHSKLGSTQWPSRRGLELKLRTFLSRQDVAVPTFYKRPDAGDAGYSDSATCGLGTYPVGVGSFEETPLGESTWAFASAVASAAASAGAPSPANTQKTSDSDEGPSGLNNVQWVFDSRGVVVPPLFEAGTTVYVTEIPRPGVPPRGSNASKVERHPLLGIVKTVPVDPSGSMRIKLKYFAREETVKEAQLLSLAQHVPDDDLVGREEVPLPLCTLLLLAGLLQTGVPYTGASSLPVVPHSSGKSPIVFRVDEMGVDFKDHASGAVHLGRSSLFHQLRQIALQVEARFASEEDNEVTHAALGASVDVQLAYSENSLNWVASRFGQVVDTLALQSLMVEWAKRAVLERQETAQHSPSKVSATDLAAATTAAVVATAPEPELAVASPVRASSVPVLPSPDKEASAPAPAPSPVTPTVLARIEAEGESEGEDEDEREAEGEGEDGGEGEQYEEQYGDGEFEDKDEA